jgi:nitrogen fixation-related uncharacterized protein
MKVRFFIFFVGLALGVFASTFFFKPDDSSALPPVSVASAADFRKEAATSETSYAKSYDSLKKRSVSLYQELNNSKSALAKAKAKNALLQKGVLQLIENRVHIPLSEYPEADSNCDSLIVTVEYLMKSSVEKDSLFENITTTLEDQVKNKDSTIALKNEQYNDLKNVFEKSVVAQEVLTEQNKALYKQQRKEKIESKFLSAALLVITGGFVKHLLNR